MKNGKSSRISHRATVGRHATTHGVADTRRESQETRVEEEVRGAQNSKEIISAGAAKLKAVTRLARPSAVERVLRLVRRASFLMQLILRPPTHRCLAGLEHHDAFVGGDRHAHFTARARRRVDAVDALWK